MGDAERKMHVLNALGDPEQEIVIKGASDSHESYY
jgi:hypothetical protein